MLPQSLDIKVAGTLSSSLSLRLSLRAEGRVRSATARRACLLRAPSRMAWALLALTLLLISGCAVDGPSEPVSLSSWQKDLEQYVWDQANGDPDVLREMSWDDVHRGFAII